MIEQLFLVVLAVVGIFYAINIGKLLERIRVYGVLNATVDAMDEISGKPAQYRLGYLAALTKVGHEVHDR